MPAIREGIDADGPGLLRLIGTCWAEYEDCVLDLAREAPKLATAASDMRALGGRMFVAGDVDGTVSVVPDGGGGWVVRRMYVAPAFRGTGLAHALMDRAEAHAEGATRLSLHSDSRFRRAHAFYEKRSFLRRSPAEVPGDLSGTVDLLFAKPQRGLSVEKLDATAASSAVGRLATILMECVAQGASVSFHHPLPVATARAFWRGTADRVAAGRVVLFTAWLDGMLAGTVTLDTDMKPNQWHRADIGKLLVAPSARRRGIAQALMARAEAAAWEMGRSLLVLDTMSGSTGESLYRARGWIAAGGIPGYSRDAAGRAEDMTLFYKTIPA